MMSKTVNARCAASQGVFRRPTGDAGQNYLHFGLSAAAPWRPGM